MKNLVQNITSIWNKHIHRALAAPRLRLFALLFACVASLGFAFAQSGKCGENLTWTLENGVLTISGTGPMQDFDFNDTTSWHYNRTSISSVVINEGITSIGKYAFQNCTNLQKVDIPDTVTSIGDNAFRYSKVKNIYMASVNKIGRSAFSGCEQLEMVVFPLVRFWSFMSA